MIDGHREESAVDAPAAEDAPRRGIGRRLVRLGVTADHVTLAGIVLSAVNAVVIGLGDLYVACALLIVGGLMDTLDGVVAKAAGSASPRGAFFDSVADRVSDALVFSGLAYYLAVSHHPKEALLPVAVLAVSSVISYERAKAESLGFNAKGGLMERAERLIVFGLAMLVHVVMIEILWVLLALTVATAIGRFARVWRQASGAPVRVHTVGAAWRRGRVESRWRSLRETGSALPPRLSSSPSTRWRNRRRSPTLSTRLRSVLATEGAGGQRRRSPSAERAAKAMRRRIDDGRSH